MKKAIGFLVFLMVLTATALAEEIPVDAAHFPDDNFRAYVAQFLDPDGDGVLSEEERNAVTYINVNQSNIVSMEGIAYFPALESLWCDGNQLTSLDASGNPALELLTCEKNQLTHLDVSGNPTLRLLYCEVNQLTSLDISACFALEHLYCQDNRLTSLDVSGNPALQKLWCFTNQLTSLDVSANSALQRLYCHENQLTSVDVSANSNLVDLGCGKNQLAVTAENGKFDLSVLPGFDAARASDWNGGTVEGTMLTVPASGDVTYTYDCGKGYTETFTLSVTVTGEPTQEPLPGDVGGDGKVDGRDLLRLAKFIAGQEVAIDEKAADLNGDGKVDGRDVLRLAKKLAGM